MTYKIIDTKNTYEYYVFLRNAEVESYFFNSVSMISFIITDIKF